MTRLLTLFTLTWAIFSWAVVYAADEDEEKHQRYLTPEDKRDASLGHEVADGAVVSLLLETESQRRWEDYGDSSNTLDGETAYTVQLAAEIEMAEWLVVELVGEAEKERQWRSQLEEAVLALEWENWSADIGRFYAPFGEYYSQFIGDVAIEAGETRGTNLSIDYNWENGFEWSGFFVHHDDDRVNVDKKDWGMGLVYIPESIDAQFGLAYLSGIVDDDDVREVYATEEKLYDAWTASVLLGLENWVITAEALRAERRGFELPHQFKQFGGVNVEAGYYWSEGLRLSARWQENRGVLSSPVKQTGLGFNWATRYKFSLTVEQLWNDYQPHEEVDVVRDKEFNFGVVVEF